MGRRGGHAEMRCGAEGHWQWNRRSHIHVRWVKIGRVPCEQVIPVPGQARQPRVLAPRRQIPITSGCKNKWVLEWQKKPPNFQETWLKGPARTYYILPCIMCTHILCTLYTGLLYLWMYPWYAILIPMYTAHSHFPLKNLHKKVCIICGKIW